MEYARWCLGSNVDHGAEELRDGHWVPDQFVSVAFTTERRSVMYTLRRCRVCQQTRRDATKSKNRLAVKARNTITSHTKRYAKRWNVPTSEARQRLERFGWWVQPIEDMFRDAEFRDECPECHWAWDGAEHQMTLDVGNPDTPTLDTCQVICMSCNRRYGRMPLHARSTLKAYSRYLHSITEQQGQQRMFG